MINLKPENYRYTQCVGSLYQAPLYSVTDPDSVPTLKIGHGKETDAPSLRYDRSVEIEAKKRKLQTKEVIQESRSIVKTELKVSNEQMELGKFEVTELKNELSAVRDENES